MPKKLWNPPFGILRTGLRIPKKHQLADWQTNHKKNISSLNHSLHYMEDIQYVPSVSSNAALWIISSSSLPLTGVLLHSLPHLTLPHSAVMTQREREKKERDGRTGKNKREEGGKSLCQHAHEADKHPQQQMTHQLSPPPGNRSHIIYYMTVT